MSNKINHTKAAMDRRLKAQGPDYEPHMTYHDWVFRNGLPPQRIVPLKKKEAREFAEKLLAEERRHILRNNTSKHGSARGKRQGITLVKIRGVNE